MAHRRNLHGYESVQLEEDVEVGSDGRVLLHSVETEDGVVQWGMDQSESLDEISSRDGSDDGRAFKLPPPASGRKQLAAMLWRQWLFKKRASTQTVMELVSPILMLSLLVLGWTRSTVDHYDAEVFVNGSIPIFEEFEHIFLDSRNLLSACPPATLLEQQLSSRELELLAALVKGQLSQTMDFSGFNWTANATSLDGFMKSGQEEAPPLVLTPELLLLSLRCVNTAQEALRALSLLNEYSGSLPVPSFDAFVAAHKFISKALDAQEGQLAKSVHLQKKFGNILGNLLELGQIVFAPNTSTVANVVDYLRSEYQYFDEAYGGTFHSEQEAIDASLQETGKPIWAIVVVQQLDVAAGNVDYTIRMNYTTVPSTEKTVHTRKHGLIDGYKHYYTSGFLSVQNAVNSYVFKNLSNTKQGDVLVNQTVWGAPFPVAEYNHNRFYDVVGPMMGLVMCLSTLYPLAMLVKALVEEKETRAKETMQIMGLKPWVFSLSWLTTYTVVFFIASVFVTILLKITFFPRSASSIIFILFFLFSCSLISFGFFISVFFNRAKLAALVAPFVHFAAIMPRYVFFRTGSAQALPGKSASSLLPPTAFTFGVDLIGQYEGADAGLTWANITEDDFSLGWIFLLFVVDCIIYGLLAWYLEQVLPSEYGGRLSPWFFVTSSYWRGGNKYNGKPEYEMLTTDTEEADLQNEVEPIGGENFHAAVQVKDLRKVYSGGKVAVDGLNLTIYQDQITALLGHNGAGKSTTISMLTGLIRPTAGDAEIWGHSIRGDLSSIRRTIGVCPQQNVLYGNLTVKEHLELFAALKGIPDKLVRQEVQEMVERLSLSDKTNSPASSLSGGMKCKLQVAIAMLGGSKVVFLDEPTSGMDPHARRAMWELLRTFKQGRAIVLTTHYMDEADLLCDRIAIMSDGRLRCCGSSLYLKAKYGVGYNLTMTKSSSACSEAVVRELILKYLPQAVPLSSAGGEMAFQLPVANKAAFAELFEELEQEKNTIGVGGYGVSMTTLEEVFIRLANEDISPVSKLKSSFDELNGHDAINSSSNFAPDVSDRDTESLLSNGERQGSASKDRPTETTAEPETFKKETCTFFTAFSELLKKRVIIARRDIKGLINTILLPVAVIAFVMLILKLNIDPAGPQLQLQFGLFKPSLASYDGHQQNLMIPVAGAPVNSLPSFGRDGFVELEGEQAIEDSVQMSEHLLATIDGPPRYGALIYNDTLLPQYNTSILRDVNVTDLKRIFPNSTFIQSLPNGTLGDLPILQTPSGQGLWSPLTLLHNTSSEHSMPVLIQELAQARLRAALNLSTASFQIRSHPLPLTKEEASRLQTMLTVLAALFVLIPFCYLAASFSVFVVRERVVKAKLLQMLSGANTYSYWAATYCWDMMNYSAIVAITMLVFVVYRDQAFIGSWTKAGAVLVLLICFGLSVLPLSYCYSFAFASHANAQVAIAGIHFVTGFVMLVASTVMGALQETKAMNRWLVHIWQWFPPYNLGRGLVKLSALDLQTTFLGGTAHPYKWDVLGCPIVLMLIEAVGYMTLTIIIDDDWLAYLWKALSTVLQSNKGHSSAWSAVGSTGNVNSTEDIDVSNERTRIESGLGDEDAVRVQNLWKLYPGNGQEPTKVAVRELCLGIPAGQCFGFLGVNGAGKTTTLSMLSGDVKPTSGNAFINGHSVLTDLKAVQRYIGYCPQFDPLLDLMTGKEHLDMYARLKGVPKHKVRETVDDVLKAVGLQKYAGVVAGDYSGGNKRKLALAIALVGDPAVVFLDEPSSGMDPVARRAMWDVIVDAVTRRDVSMVLTTHSMEECEALCGRVGVMVAGRLVCLGSVQHLKSRFGNGYNVELQCKRPEDMQKLHEMIDHSFPGATLEEQHSTRVKYSLPLEGLSLSQVFGTIEAEKERVGLEDYSVCQSTLEQIFISFAKGRDTSSETTL